MALRSGLAKWRQGLQLAAGLAAGSMTYAICESDVRAPSFDPEALERGAKALREINASPNAKKVTTCSLAIWLWRIKKRCRSMVSNNANEQFVMHVFTYDAGGLCLVPAQ